YLPLELMVPIFLGGLLSHIVGRRRGLTANSTEEEHDRVHRPGTLFAAGLITGEALMGIAIAFPIVITSNRNVLALPEALHFGPLVGLAVLAAVVWLFYRSSKNAAISPANPQE
ncbi:OPT/YSL family transporter, partial [Streptomyces sp. S9]|nr:OPT/YSL family transporter [Streptomyces sp. S9]